MSTRVHMIPPVILRIPEFQLRAVILCAYGFTGYWVLVKVASGDIPRVPWAQGVGGSNPLAPIFTLAIRIQPDGQTCVSTKTFACGRHLSATAALTRRPLRFLSH